MSAVSHWSAARNGSESESDSDGSEIPILERPHLEDAPADRQIGAQKETAGHEPKVT